MRFARVTFRASSLTQKNKTFGNVPCVLWPHSRHGSRRNTARFGLIAEFSSCYIYARARSYWNSQLWNDASVYRYFPEIAARNSIVSEGFVLLAGTAGRKWSFSLGIRTGYFTNALISAFISGNGRLKFGSDFFSGNVCGGKRRETVGFSFA